MSSKLFLFLTLIYCTNGGKIHEISVEPTSQSTITTSSTTTHSSSEYDYLDNISIQDVLSSDVDASEKIEKKITNAIVEYSSKLETLKKIQPFLREFYFHNIDPIIVNLDAANVTFLESIITSKIPPPPIRSLHFHSNLEKTTYSTSIACDSSTTSRIKVNVPKNIVISSDLGITENKNTPDTIFFYGGRISITLQHNTFSKQSSTQRNSSSDYEDNVTSELQYAKSEVQLETDTKYQMAIYKKLDIWFDQVESFLKQNLLQRLDAELANDRISVTEICSKFITPEKNAKKINSPIYNDNFHNLYVIPNAKLETWKGVHLSAGPIVINGLSSFNSTELTVSQSEPFNSFPVCEEDENEYFRQISQSETNTTTIRLKTNDLYGKVDWSYNSKQSSFSFTLEFIQFEIKTTEWWKYTLQNEPRNIHCPQKGTNDYFDGGSYYSRSKESKTDLNVHLGNLQIKPSKSTGCENENEFLQFVLSEYLKTVIVDSLKTSLSGKLSISALAHYLPVPTNY